MMFQKLSMNKTSKVPTDVDPEVEFNLGSTHKLVWCALLFGHLTSEAKNKSIDL
jgi:hypothetical protein